MKEKIFKRLSVVGLVILVIPSAASGHTYGADSAGWAEGFFHPTGGLDHLLAMIAVGLWAAQRGGMGMVGVPLPYVESEIAASVLVLGLLIATAARLPLSLSLILTGSFALFHGHAHGTELPQTASAFTYSMGFILATALLHAAGIVMGLFVLKARVPKQGIQLFFRLGGSAIAAAGVVLFTGVF